MFDDYQIPSTFDPFADAEDSSGGAKEYVPNRIQQRNGKKSLTTVQGQKKEKSLTKVQGTKKEKSLTTVEGLKKEKSVTTVQGQKKDLGNDELEFQIPSAFDPFADAEDSSSGAKEYVHIRIQQRNGKKSLTTVQGLKKDLFYEEVLKKVEKEFCCDCNVVEDEVLGKVIQLQGDDDQDVDYEKVLKKLKKDFCCKGKIVEDEVLGKVIQLRIDQDLGYEKVLKKLKKEFCCNGNVVEDKVLGKVIQLQGDQRKNVSDFLVKDGLVNKDLIKIHGF